MIDINAFCGELKAPLEKYGVVLVCSDPYEFVEFVDRASLPSVVGSYKHLQDGSIVTYHYPTDLY